MAKGLLAFALVFLIGCGTNSQAAEAPSSINSAAATSVRISPLTPRDPGRVTKVEAAAIAALGSSQAGPPPPYEAGMVGMNMNMEGALSAVDQKIFDVQWAAAQRAVPNYDTEAKAAALGFVQASTIGPGVGTHWVSWTQVAKPFDPAHPAMLLFDERKTPARLIGFSYWVQSSTAPAGFAGANDVWHRHSYMCVVNGWLDREEAQGPNDCAGTILAGGDLWMLHAWVVPTFRNRLGHFAVFNPTFCPPAAGTPDDSRCPT